MVIMSIESEDSEFVFVPEIDLLVCPFFELCEFRNINSSPKYPIVGLYAPNIFQKLRD